MTRFIPSFSTQQLLPPWASQGARNWAFMLRVPKGCIQNYLDHWFNAKGPDQAPYYWQATSGEEHDYGILLVCDHTDFSHVEGDTPGYERLAHREVFWMFPARRYDRTPDNLVVGRGTDVWIQPFALDNNSFLMFSSREIWGCEKDMADILLDEKTEPGALHIDVAIEGCKTFTPRSISHLIGVMHLRMGESQDKPPNFLDGDSAIGTLLGQLLAALAGPTSNPKTHETLRPNRMEINTLKQFRDAFDMRYAAYRAISASQVVHTDVVNQTFYNGENVSIDFMWSDTCGERWENLFGLTKPPRNSPERGHPHGDSHSLGKKIDWDMPRVKGDVVMAMSFTANTRFDVLETLFTYGLPSGI